MGDDFGHPFSVEWVSAGQERLTLDGLKSLARQLPGAPVCADAGCAQIIGRVDAAEPAAGGTIRIRGVMRVPIEPGAEVRPQYRLRRASVVGGVLMVSALDTVSMLVPRAGAPTAAQSGGAAR